MQRRDRFPETLSLREELTAGDEPAIEALVRATGAFTEEEIAIAADLVRERLARGASSGYEFLLIEEGSGAARPRLAGYACYGRIPGTRASWDLYWIAVAPTLQGQTLGRRLLEETEARVAAAGGQQLYVDTSGRTDYARTRRFYERAGYRCEATLRDFYAPGDAKLVYVKSLGRPSRSR